MTTLDAFNDGCVHHWMLTPPRREVTSAVCKLCGAEREYLDSDSRSAWNAGRALKTRSS